MRSEAKHFNEGRSHKHVLNLDRSARALSWLDFKLGLRMLARYPAMTVVGSLAMALGIAIGAGVFQLVSELIFPDHPYAEVDRIAKLVVAPVVRANFVEVDQLDPTKRGTGGFGHTGS